MFIYDKINIDKNQTKLIIKRNDYNVPANHISRFVVEFIENSFEKLDIQIEEKKRGRKSFNLCSMLKLLVWGKIEHRGSAKVIEEMTKYHDILNSYVME